MVKDIKQAWAENKVVLIMLSVVLTGLLGWGVWVTHGIYAGTFNQEKIVGLCSDIEDVKKEVNGLKIKMDVQTVKMDIQVLKAESNQVEILKMQNEIMKELRRK